eukprot:Gb_41634 [translate_table: standard]
MDEPCLRFPVVSMQLPQPLRTDRPLATALKVLGVHMVSTSPKAAKLPDLCGVSISVSTDCFKVYIIQELHSGKTLPFKRNIGCFVIELTG